MRASCPNNPKHTLFVATAVVAQEWLVDAEGNKIQGNEIGEVLQAPATNNEAQWRCNECNAIADFVAGDVKSQ